LVGKPKKSQRILGPKYTMQRAFGEKISGFYFLRKVIVERRLLV